MGHSLAAWKAHYDKRGSLRRGELAAQLFAALPLGAQDAQDAAGPAAEAPPSDEAESASESDSDSESQGESGGAGAGASRGGASALELPRGGAATPASGTAVGNGAATAPGPAPSLQPAGGAGGAASGGTLQDADDGDVSALNGGISLLGLQDLWDAEPAPRGRRAAQHLPPLAAMFARKSKPFELRPRPGGRERWLTAWEARKIRLKGTAALREALARLLQASPGSDWTPDVYIAAATSSRGAKPNGAAMEKALCGGGNAWRHCARAGCSDCSEAEAAWLARVPLLPPP
jgi:hypothetical protein